MREIEIISVNRTVEKKVVNDLIHRGILDSNIIEISEPEIEISIKNKVWIQSEKGYATPAKINLYFAGKKIAIIRLLLKNTTNKDMQLNKEDIEHFFKKYYFKESLIWVKDEIENIHVLNK